MIDRVEKTKLSGKIAAADKIRRNRVFVARDANAIAELQDRPYAVWAGDVEALLKALPKKPLFDLVVTSPPYNIGKAYEEKRDLKEYIKWQASIIKEIVPRLKETGSLCWQVGNFVDNDLPPIGMCHSLVFAKHPQHSVVHNYQ